MNSRRRLYALAGLILLYSTNSLNAANPFSTFFTTLEVFITSLFAKKAPKQIEAPHTEPEAPVLEPVNLTEIELPSTINYFDKNFLKNYPAVYKSLLNDGFTPVSFKTVDNLRLYGLFLERPHATATVIFCNGFFPGRKETSAPLTTFVPANMNILLFDARAHGHSEGNSFAKLPGFKNFGMFSNIASYGLHEYKDIIGAIAFAAERTGKPIIIHGICSGAFNATRAILKLQDHNLLETYQVKGLICDSGWASVKSAANNAPYAFVEKELINKYNPQKRTPTQVQQAASFKASYNLLAFIVGAFKKLFIDYRLHKTDNKTNLFYNISNLSIPVFYIHSVDDTYSPFKEAEHLARNTPNCFTWWIEPNISYHTDHHFKLSNEYRTKMHTFFSYALVNR